MPERMTREEAHDRLKKLVDDFFDGLEESEEPKLSPAREALVRLMGSTVYVGGEKLGWDMFHAGVDWMADRLLEKDKDYLPGNYWAMGSREAIKQSREEGKR